MTHMAPLLPALLLPALLLLALPLSACGQSEPEKQTATVSAGIERSVADVRAAEAAASGPISIEPGAPESSAQARKASEGDISPARR